MFIPRISARTSVMLAMVIALFMQSSYTLRYVNAQEKIKMAWAENRILSAAQTVKALEDMNANSWMYNCKYGIDGFENILANTVKNSTINVDPYIGSGNSHGCGNDFNAWAAYFANLSLKYPKLKSYSIDDFHPSKFQYKFSSDQVKAWMDVKNRINPEFKFLPVMYYDGGELRYFKEDNPYKTALSDGSQMWLWESYERQNPVRALKHYIDQVPELMPPACCITGIYPIMYSQLSKSTDVNRIFHDPDSLRKMLKMSLDGTDGLVLFEFPVWLSDTVSLFRHSRYQKLQNDDRNFDFKLGNNENKRTPYHWYQAVTTTISLPPNIGSARIYCKIRDNSGVSSTQDIAERFYKQLVVDDKVIWEADVRGDGTQTTQIDKDITGYLSGNSARITIRVISKPPGYEKVSVYVGGITVRINNQTIRSDFKFESGILHFHKWMEVYNIAKEVFGSTGPGINRETTRNAGTLRLCDFSRVYTNRFERSTVIGYRLPVRSNVSLRIYDVAGRLVTSLVDRKMNEGYHSVKWGAKGTVPGVYFVNLETGKHSAVKRIINFE